MPTPNTALSSWRTPLRTVLGDTEAVYGENDYTDAALDSAVRAVFAMGKGPSGCELRNDSDAAVTPATLGDGTNVYPSLALGAAAFGEILLRAALVLVSPEDGAMWMTTRPFSVRDMGQRKRDLLDWLRQELSEIEAGDTFSFNPVTWNQDLQGRD